MVEMINFRGDLTYASVEVATLANALFTLIEMFVGHLILDTF